MPEQILKSFPKDIHDDVIQVVNLLGKLNLTDHSISKNIQLDDQPIELFARVYNSMPEEELINSLTDIQKTILHCIYTRHHDGYVREKHLREIISSEYYWVVPFVVQLLGEYVIEIGDFIASHSASLIAMDSYRKFYADNPEFIYLTRQRAISYWNCYYRWIGRGKEYPLEEYPTIKFFSELNNVAKSEE
jgi:hypothetical protein